LLLPAGGAARARRTIALTDEGRRAVAGLGAALEPVALHDLDEPARALLVKLAAGEKRAPVGEAAALKDLAARGLVAVDEEVRTAGARSETLARVARPLDGDELVRAP